MTRVGFVSLSFPLSFSSILPASSSLTLSLPIAFPFRYSLFPHNPPLSLLPGVVKNLMVKTPAEPDLANRRATEMMQRMKTIETLGADKEALYKEGFRGGLSSGLHDTFDNIKKEQRSCDESIDSLNKR